jgi:thiol-disulfide isomerase/thioredoxin
MIALAAQSAFAADKQPLIANPVDEKGIRTLLKKPQGKLSKTDLAKGNARQTREEKQWLDLISKPIELQFAAIDGRKVDLAKMRGKVALIYCCASWCPPCVHEYPKLKASYEKLHNQGVEFIGISLERRRGQLDKYTREKNLLTTI